MKNLHPFSFPFYCCKGCVSLLVQEGELSILLVLTSIFSPESLPLLRPPPCGLRNPSPRGRIQAHRPRPHRLHRQVAAALSSPEFPYSIVPDFDLPPSVLVVN